MAISRSLMNRQLRADGGIMQVAPREKFGLGSKLKKFVRKIIPNEVSEIAVKAAPFVAPFNPAVAAAMSGLGTFDQTGSIGDSLKGGALTYGLGQGARYLGGAGFQGNPFGDGGAFTGGLQGFKGGFSSPLGNQTGFKLGKPVQEVQGIGDNTIIPKQKPTNLLSEQMSEVSLSPSGSVVTSDSILTSPSGSGSAMDSFKSIVSFDTSAGQKTDAALDLLKRGSKALFYDSEGKLDRAAVIGAVTAAASYAEAKALAADAGVDLTEEEYDESLRDEKKAEYAGYLQNFFGGKKDGGRIGFESGANEMIKTQLLEEIMPDTSTEDMIMIMTEDGPKMIKRSDFEAMSGMFRDTTTSAYGDAGRGRPVPEFANGGRIGFKGGYSPGIVSAALEEYNSVYGTDSSGEEILVKDLYSGGFEEFLEIYTGDAYEKRANGGRIGFKKGSPEETSEIGIMAIDVEAGDDEDEEDMMMAGITFSRPEKSYLFRRLGGSGGSDRSYTMPNLYRILNNPNKYPEDAAILKEIAIMGLGKGQKDGGRIGLKDGTDESLIEKLLNSKIAQEGRYGASEFFFGDPIMFGTPDKFKDGKNDNRGTFKRDSSDYDKLSPEKQAYIEAFLNSDEGQLFLKPGKIKFPTNEKMREHNKKITLEDFNEDRNPLELLLGIDYENRAKGGRIGYKGGANRVSELLMLRDSLLASGEDVSDIEAEIFQLTGKTFKSVGGISNIPTGKMRKNNAGVVERDYRDEGGFVPVGIKERADDVPAMLSKNEFVMTADAVRGIGNGSVEEGSKKLYNTMKKAEQVGKA